MNVLESCPVCENQTHTKFIDCKDFTVSMEQFVIARCNQCGFLFTNPRPEEKQIGKYYESEDYVSHSGTSKGLINKLYHSIREYTIKKKVNLIKYSNPTASTILDYGAGTGEFLNAIKKAGFTVNGIEPSSEARKRAMENFGLNLHPQFNSKESPVFDVITMWHVLEHVHMLNTLLADLYAQLDSRGTLIIAVPNCDSYDASFYKQYWAAYDVPRHLYHFSKNTMEKLLDKHRFRIDKIYPMYFDSFYVSMLSEKYKGNNGLLGLIRAGIIGGASNLMGAIDLKYFSSLIYVARKGS